MNKDEKIDNLKNKISMALKDPILQLGFEIICKKLAKLEKENAELKEQVNEWLNTYSDTSLVKVLRDCIYKNEKLSSQQQQQLSAWVECAMDFGNNLDECAAQLTKAEEHIRTLISCLIDWVQEGDKDYCHIAEAEQFLKEE